MTDSPLPDPAEAIAAVRNYQRHFLLRTFGPNGHVIPENVELSEHLTALIDYAERAGEAMRWRPIEEAPTKTVIIVAFQNSQGKWRRTLAAYYGERELEASIEFEGGDYDEERDEYFCPAGWYEPVEAETGLDYSLHHLDETPLRWRPLPPAPDSEPGNE